MKSKFILALATACASLTAPNVKADTVLITGCDRGLGLEFARQYAEKGWNVIATTRNPSTATELTALARARPTIAVEKLDLLDEAGIKALAAKYRGTAIDVLINSAGVPGDLKGQRFGTFDHAEFLKVMDINVYGALAVCEAFLDNVLASAQKKIVTISRGPGMPKAPDGRFYYYYSASKQAENLCMQTMAHDLKSKGVICGVIGPGHAETEMAKYIAGPSRWPASDLITPAASVSGMIKVIDHLTSADADMIFSYTGHGHHL